MTRLLRLLHLVIMLGVIGLTGCAQMAWQRENSNPLSQGPQAPKMASNQARGFSTSMEEESSAKDQVQQAAQRLTDPAQGREPSKQPKFTPPPPLPPPPPGASNTAVEPTLELPKIPSSPPPAQVQTPPVPPTPPGSPIALTSGEKSSGSSETREKPPASPERIIPPLEDKTQSPGGEPLVEAMRCLLAERHQEALEHLKKYDAATQDLFLRILPPLAYLARKKIQDLNEKESTVVSNGIEAIQQQLRPRTELLVDRACCCEWVKSFGNYQPLPEGHIFVASSPNRPGERVQLYVEVKNFASENRGEYFETCLASDVEIRDTKGEKIWFHRFEDRQYPIRSRTLLHDYFNNYCFFVPNLPAGTYNLIIHITDLTRPETPRETQKALEFRVGSSLR